MRNLRKCLSLIFNVKLNFFNFLNLKWEEINLINVNNDVAENVKKKFFKFLNLND